MKVMNVCVLGICIAFGPGDLNSNEITYPIPLEMSNIGNISSSEVLLDFLEIRAEKYYYSGIFKFKNKSKNDIILWKKIVTSKDLVPEILANYDVYIYNNKKWEKVENLRCVSGVTSFHVKPGESINISIPLQCVQFYADNMNLQFPLKCRVDLGNAKSTSFFLEKVEK